MNELEQLKLERNILNIKIQNLERDLLPKYNYIEYENRYFRYVDSIIHFKKWTGGSVYDTYTSFDYICIKESCIEYIEDSLINMSEIYEITKEEYETEFNKVLNKLK
jgi:hypothetical protein